MSAHLGSKLDQLASKVPSLPGVIHELKKALSDIDNPVNTIEQVINKDPAFAARVLKLANSAYHSFTFRVATISQALMLMGLSELRSLLIGTSMVRVFKGVKTKAINMESFWKHSVACAICCRQLAIKHREVNVEEFFMAGLLHDLGRLIMFCSIPEKTEKASQVASQRRISITAAESKLLGFNHADLSAQILKEWRLPESLYEVVRAHHNPSASATYRKQAMIVHVSDIIVDAMGLGDSGEAVITASSDIDLVMFQNLEATLAAVMDELDSMTDEITRIFTAED